MLRRGGGERDPRVFRSSCGVQNSGLGKEKKWGKGGGGRGKRGKGFVKKKKVDLVNKKVQPHPKKRNGDGKRAKKENNCISRESNAGPIESESLCYRMF